MNQRAFLWGRIAAASPQAAAEAIGGLESMQQSPPDDLDELVASYAAELTKYQNATYASRYVKLVDRVRDAEKILAASDRGRLARTVALNAFKLMAYKDEYEIARLYSAASFKSGLRSQIDGGRLSVWLAPPLLARHDPATGRPRKIRFGPWVFSVFAVLARMRGLRGTRFDPFGLNPERAAERKLLEDYFLVVDELANRLRPGNLETALTLAALPDQVRGYGPVKMKAMAEFDAAKEGLLSKFRAARSIPISSAACR
jgi:indolepyruvate ferredoxin oxidoreductase